MKRTTISVDEKDAQYLRLMAVESKQKNWALFKKIIAYIKKNKDLKNQLMNNKK